jgi:hypothetical protein
MLVVGALVFLISAVEGVRIPKRSSTAVNRLGQLSWNSEEALSSKRVQLNRTILEPHHFKKYGSKRVMLRYGPFSVPTSHEKHGMKEFNELDVEKPCNNCLITSLQAGLEYPNGTYANANTGMWLHHIVTYDFARKDMACPDLPYRFFASGNERTPLDLTVKE